MTNCFDMPILSNDKYPFKNNLPIFVVSAIALLAGLVPVMLQTPSFTRIVITTIVCEVVFLPLVWLFILDKSERLFVKDRFFAVIRKARSI